MQNDSYVPIIYLDEAASDALIETMSSAPSDTVAESFKKPLRIRPTFHPLSIRSEQNESGEEYEITICSIPSDIIKPIHAAAGSEVLKIARSGPQDFLDGIVKVSGFEENTDIQRYSVCISQSMRIWLADQTIPESPNSIVLVSGEQPEIKLLCGEERPSLAYMKYNPDTGKPESCSLPLYDTSPAGLEEFSAGNAEIFCMSKVVRDKETGEERTLPVFGAEAEAVRYNLELIQRGREILESKHYNVRENTNCSGADFGGTDVEKTCSLRVFLSMDSLQKLPVLPFAPKALPERLRKKCLLDFMDVALSAIIETDRERRVSNLKLYKRIAVTMFSPIIAEMKYERRQNREFFYDGNITCNGGKNECFTAVAAFDAFRKIAGILIACGCVERISSAKDTGIYITVSEEMIAVVELTGRRRPPLGAYLADSFGLYRPYTDELGDENDDTDEDASGDRGLKIIGAINKEQIEALLAQKTERLEPKSDNVEALTVAAADGNVEAMKRLGKMYETGNGAEQSNEKALELYKKAQALLPDDPDLEFDILMLEMMM